jgi:hypothetical protein
MYLNCKSSNNCVERQQQSQRPITGRETRIKQQPLLTATNIRSGGGSSNAIRTVSDAQAKRCATFPQVETAQYAPILVRCDNQQSGRAATMGSPFFSSAWLQVYPVAGPSYNTRAAALWIHTGTFSTSHVRSVTSELQQQ